MKLSIWRPTIVAVLVAVPTCLAQTPSFTGLTDPFPGGYVDSVRAVSADGSVVVGYTYKPTSSDFGDRSFRWRRGIGFDNPGPSQGIVLSLATGVSADGNVVCGYTGHAAFGDQEAWVRVGASRGHVGSPPGKNFSSLFGASANGQICIGYGGDQSDANSAEAARYFPDTDQWTNLGFLPGGGWSKAFACSADGSVIVGGATSSTVLYESAFVWTASTGMQPVGAGNPPGGIESEAIGVSADGSVIVGNEDSLGAWRWTAGTGMTIISADFSALGVSPDGNVIVGYDTANGVPVIWDAANGVRNLHDVCVEQGLGPAMEGWFMGGAAAINQQGSVYAVAGWGGDPSDHIAGWVVRLELTEAPCLTITTQPTDFTACSSGYAVFSVSASGAGPVTFQWRKGSVAIDPIANPFAGTPNLLLVNVSAADIGVYDCVLTNACGSVTSDAAALALCLADFDCDGFLTGDDFDAYVAAFVLGDTLSDFDFDGFVTGDDFDAFVAAFESGC